MVYCGILWGTLTMLFSSNSSSLSYKSVCNGTITEFHARSTYCVYIYWVCYYVT